MEISNKDKKLLVYLLAIGIISGAYFFAAKPLMDKQQSLATEVDNLKTQVNHYSEIYQNKESYESQVSEAEVRYEELLGRFKGDLNQENTIMLMKDIEKATNVWISKIIFTDPVSSDDVSQVDEAEIPEDMGESVEMDTPEETATPSGNRQDLSLEFSGNYSEFKKFIDFVKDYDKRLYISSLSAQYNVDSNRVSGNVNLSQYALTGTDMEVEERDLSNVSLGTSNIFTTLRNTDTGLEFDIKTLTDTDEDSEQAEDVSSEDEIEPSEDADNEGTNDGEDVNE